MPTMTRLEAIARLEEWAVAPATMSYLAKELREIIAALREPGEPEKPSFESVHTFMRANWPSVFVKEELREAWEKHPWSASPPPSQPPGPSPIVAHSAAPMTTAQMSAALDVVSKPSEQPSVPLNFDPDSVPFVEPPAWDGEAFERELFQWLEHNQPAHTGKIARRARELAEKGGANG